MKRAVMVKPMIRHDPKQGAFIALGAARWGFALCFLLALLRLSSTALWSVLVVTAVLTVSGRRWGTLGLWRAFGCCVVLMPLAGDGALLAVSLCMLMLGGRAPLVPSWAQPFFVVLLAHLAAGIAVDLSALGGLWIEGAVSLGSWRVSSPYGLPALGVILRSIVLLGIFSTLRAEIEIRRHLLDGLCLGAVLGGGIIGASLAFPDVVTLPNDTDLWRSLRRHVGTFTDPNAFGVAVVLLVALLLERSSAYTERSKRAAGFGLAGVWCLLALTSGSRAFFLGMGTLVMTAIFLRSRRLMFGVLLCGVFALVAVQFVPLSTAGLPVGLERLLASLRWERLGETFHSRSVFWSIGGAVVADHPLLGVGLGSFSRVVEPYSRALGISLGGWTDNANSYYLGILAEMGLVGALAWLFSVSRLSWRATGGSSRWPVCGIVAFLAMCVVGPHLDFDEVSVLFGVVLSGAVSVRERRSSAPRAFWYPQVAVGILVFLTIIFDRLEGEWGIYPFEGDGGGRFRWSAPRAHIDIPCVDGVATLTVRALHPLLNVRPVQLRLKTPLEEQTFDVISSHPHEVSVRCIPEGASTIAEPPRIEARLSVAPPLIPAQAFGGQDLRLLGVQVRASNN